MSHCSRKTGSGSREPLGATLSSVGQFMTSRALRLTDASSDAYRCFAGVELGATALQRVSRLGLLL